MGKSLRDPSTRQEMLRRLRRVRPDSRRRWGRMTPHQMICHLADTFRGVMGERPLSKAQVFIPRPLYKWIALEFPLPWPPNINTRPEIDQMVGGSRPTEFSKDVQALEILYTRFTARPIDFIRQPHPMFGPMSDEEWMRWGFLHMDHHFRQFGV